MKLPENQQNIRTYTPEVWSVRKDTIYAAITALDLGLKYVRGSLEDHDHNFGRITVGHKRWAETMEAHIRQMEDALNALRSEGKEQETPKPDHATDNQTLGYPKNMYNESGELQGAWNQHSADSIRKMYEGVSEAMIKELDSMCRKAITLHLGTQNWNLEEVTKRATLLLYGDTKITAVTLDGKPILFYGEPTFDGTYFTRKYHVVPKTTAPTPITTAPGTKEIKEAIVQAISQDRAIPSMDTCCDYAGWGYPEGPSVTWRTVELLRMAALLEVMSKLYTTAAENPNNPSPFPVLDTIMENDNFFDFDDLSSMIKTPPQ